MNEGLLAQCSETYVDGMLRSLIVSLCLLTAPVPGPVTGGFAPGEGFDGHWGIDLAAPTGTPVLAVADGMVTFAGSVAGMRSITIDHGGGLRTSVSYLAEFTVVVGQQVVTGERIGLSGDPHGSPGVHLSARQDGAYVDPRPLLECLGGVIRLLPDR